MWDKSWEIHVQKAEIKKLSHLQVLSMDFLFDDRQSGGHTLNGLVDGILDELGQCWIV